MTPHPAWMKRRFSAPRLWEETSAEPFSEVAVCSRGELRFAAEVVLATLHHQTITADVRERAVSIINRMANS